MNPRLIDAVVNPPSSRTLSATPIRSVALVDAGPDALTQLHSHLEVGRYSLTFLDSRMRPHTDIKYLAPSFIVLFLRFESPAACQLLTLLTLDPETRRIPVLLLAAVDDEELPVTGGRVDAFS